MSAVANLQSLKKIALFSSLTADDLRRIQGKITFKNFGKNEIILREEHTNDYMYAILVGGAKVVQTTDEGKEIIITVHQAGDFFGELTMIDGKTSPATVYATKDSVTAIILRRDFYDLLLQSK